MLHRPATLRSRKRKQERKKKIIFSASVFIAVLVAFAVVLSFISRIDRLQIAQIRVLGDSVVSEERIAEVANSILDTKYLWMFSQRNTLWYPKNTIAGSIGAKFDRILSVDMNIAKDDALEIKVVDRKPFATWCGSVKVLAATDCYFIDEQGHIFAPAPYFSGTAFVKYYGVVASEQPIGLQLLDSISFIALEKFVHSLDRFGLIAQDVVIGAAVHEVSFRGGGKIIFNVHDSYERIFANLESVLSSVIFKGAASSTPKKFEYIDLRFDNRVFYK